MAVYAIRGVYLEWHWNTAPTTLFCSVLLECTFLVLCSMVALVVLIYTYFLLIRNKGRKEKKEELTVVGHQMSIILVAL
jgi:predicted membrane protein